MDVSFSEYSIKHKRAEYPVLVRFMELKAGYKNSEAPSLKFNDIIILIINNGSLRVATETENHVLSAGQGILINSGTAFKLHLVSNESCGFYEIAFDVKYVLPEKPLYDLYGRPFIKKVSGKLILLNEDTIRDEAILDNCNRIVAANLVKKKGYELITRSLLSNLWFSLLEYTVDRDSTIFGKNSHTSDEKRVEAAVAYISENYSDMITLDDIADHIHLSNSECCRCFKRVLFKSPVEYLMEYRIYSAVRLLYKDPGAYESISDLSYITGFNNPSYFNKIFKRFAGCTPTAYRKLLKNDPDKAERLYTNIKEGITVL